MSPPSPSPWRVGIVVVLAILAFAAKPIQAGIGLVLLARTIGAPRAP